MTATPLHVTVVDDDTTVTDLVREVLAADGHRVDAISDGPAALAALQAAWPDVLLLDVMLPGVDGLDLCTQLRAVSPPGRRLPIILLTALDKGAYGPLAAAAGADDYVSKPFDINELRAKVRAWGQSASPPAAEA